ncbi:MAG: succinyl-diaminopimelate desuccinylase [Burkholderiaceae bacterium]
MPDQPVLALCERLIAQASVTPDDKDCQAILIERLTAIGFECETLRYGEVTNLWAHRRGTGNGPLLDLRRAHRCRARRPLDQWHSDPFVPERRDGLLYGRGAADMKSSIAAFVVACETFLAAKAAQGSIALLITSDEEGPARDGTVRVVAELAGRGISPDYCIVGEPTSVDTLGDTIKNGRRGSLGGRLTVRGVQGHIAYPHLARNPIHQLAPALAELATTEWDGGNAFFPPTTWQVSNLHAGTGATNVIPGEVVVDFNFRFSTASTAESLQQRFEAILDRHGLDHETRWNLSGRPFLTEPGALSDALGRSIQDVTGIAAALSTTGGTSDGRFIADICPQVVEFGPCNASIHKIDEHVRIADLPRLQAIFLGVLEILIR